MTVGTKRYCNSYYRYEVSEKLLAKSTNWLKVSVVRCYIGIHAYIFHVQKW